MGPTRWSMAMMMPISPGRCATWPASAMRPAPRQTGCCWNLELGRATGEDHYVEAAEHTFWNHLLAGQAEAGGWCARGDLSGLGGEVWDVCCSFHGPLGLIGALEHALRPTADGLRVRISTSRPKPSWPASMP